MYTKLGKEGSEVMRKLWIRKIHKNQWIADKGILEGDQKSKCPEVVESDILQWLFITENLL